MGFLDNSGDIILDAVLTDLGRNRLAKGDGTFRIEGFALADDEINYELYRNSNHPQGAHLSGSAYYDLNILQTPVLEAFTSNVASVKYKLLSIVNTNLLYMPMIKINETRKVHQRNTNATAQANDKFAILVDEDSSRDYAATTNPGIFESDAGMIQFNGAGVYVKLDHGLDSEELSPKKAFPNGLEETSYLVQIDNRLGVIRPKNAAVTALPAAFSFLDDDNIAHYNFDFATHPAFISGINSNETTSDDPFQVIRGPRSTTLEFSVSPSLELQDSNSLFTKLGTLSSTWTRSSGKGNATVHYIDSIVRVIGNTTGYRIDIPVRFVKKIS